MINLLSPFVTTMPSDSLAEPIGVPPISSTSRVAGSVISIMKVGGYGIVFILAIVSLVFLIMFIVKKAKGEENANKSLIVFIVLISIVVLFSFGVTILDVVWNTATMASAM